MPAAKARYLSREVEVLAARELDPEERLHWLRLCRTETIGPISFYALLRRFGSARAALDALSRLARRDQHGGGIIEMRLVRARDALRADRDEHFAVA